MLKVWTYSAGHVCFIVALTVGLLVARPARAHKVHIFAEAFAAAQITIVGIDRCRRVVIVARAKVHIAHKLAFLASNDQSHFRVCLESDKSIDNVCTRFLQAIRQRNVCRFVKSGH